MVWNFVIPVVTGFLFGGGGDSNNENGSGSNNITNIIWIIVALIGLVILLQIFLAVSDTTLAEAVGLEDEYVGLTVFTQSIWRPFSSGLEGIGGAITGLVGIGSGLFNRNNNE